VVENGVRETYSARYYNPSTGRFSSRDPLNGKTAFPSSLHKYNYASENPVNRVDPRGRDSFIDFLGTVNKSMNVAMPYLNAINCGGSIGIALVEGILLDSFEKTPYASYTGASTTLIGCVTTFVEPSGVKVLINDGFNVGSCASSLAFAVSAENNYLKNTENATGPDTAPIDFGAAVVGCAVSGIGAAVGGG
jgi:RHS repeat-associated protein